MDIGQFLRTNSPAILSGISVAGVIGTTVLAVRATPKAEDAILAAKEIKQLGADPEHTEDVSYIRLTPREIVEATWRLYVPTAVCGAATIACVIGVHQIGLRRQAALMGAYTLVDTAFRDYKRHVLEEITPQKAQKIEDDIAKERLHRNPPPPDNEVLLAGKGEQLIRDGLSGRYFKSDIESVRRAANDVNQQILQGDMYVDVNEFYDLLGLDATALGAELGWNVDNMVNPVFSTLLTPDGRACVVVGFQNLPKADFHKF